MTLQNLCPSRRCAVNAGCPGCHPAPQQRHKDPKPLGTGTPHPHDCVPHCTRQYHPVFAGNTGPLLSLGLSRSSSPVASASPFHYSMSFFHHRALRKSTRVSLALVVERPRDTRGHAGTRRDAVSSPWIAFHPLSVFAALRSFLMLFRCSPNPFSKEELSR